MNHRRHFTQKVPFWHGLVESLVLAVLFILLTFPVLYDAPTIVNSMVLVLLMALFMLWAGIRIEIQTEIPFKTANQRWTEWYLQNKTRFQACFVTQCKDAFLLGLSLAAISIIMCGYRGRDSP